MTETTTGKCPKCTRAPVTLEPDGVAAIRRACWEIVKRNKALEAQSRAAASVQSMIADLQERVVALENERSGEVRYAPVDERPVKPEPELVYSSPEQMWACELAETCVQLRCRSRVPHPLRDNCKQPCCAQPGDRGRCIPVPASPEVAIPDVPTPVGTEAFRRELTGHMQTLAQAYSWDADSLPVWGGHDYLERLANVACTLRDAYDLARVGDLEAAQEKLEEIRW